MLDQFTKCTNLLAPRRTTTPTAKIKEDYTQCPDCPIIT